MQNFIAYKNVNIVQKHPNLPEGTKKKNWEQVLQACFVIDCKKARGHWHVNLYGVTLL